MVARDIVTYGNEILPDVKNGAVQLGDSSSRFRK